MDNNAISSSTIGFEQQIWKAADILRGNIDASEYKHVILGLVTKPSASFLGSVVMILIVVFILP
jgi:hypothetical protein